MALSTESFLADGSQKDFTIASTILSESHIGVHFYYDDGTGFKDHPVLSSDWDVLSSTVLFNTPPPNGYVVKITISSDGTGLEDAPTSISLVASNIDKIINVESKLNEIDTVSNNASDIVINANNIDNINTNANNITSINTNANNIDSINTNATNINNINVVGNNIDNVNIVALNKTNTDIVAGINDDITTVSSVSSDVESLALISNDIQEVNTEPLKTSILNAGNNATSSQLKAWEAEAEAMTSYSYANEAEDVFAKVYTSNGDGTFSSIDTTDYSSLHWSKKSEEATAGVVHIDGDETINDIKTFTSSPKVPDGIEPTDVVNKGQLDNSSISKVASSVLLSGNVAVADSVITKSNANVTYTGNSTSQNIVTGIASVDFTVASNGSGYYHDRVAGDCIVKDDTGTIIESGSCVVNTSKVHIKCRSDGLLSHIVYDGLRGTNSTVFTNSTSQELSDMYIENVNNNGFTVSSFNASNKLNDTYIAHQTLYTHIKWGLTNQGKRYISAYNPVTREVMTMYQGSGIAGHQIPNPLGIKLDYLETKALDNGTYGWITQSTAYGDSTAGDYMWLNETGGVTNSASLPTTFKEDYTERSNNSAINSSVNTYISYGFANSETKIITQYQDGGGIGIKIKEFDTNGNISRQIQKYTSVTGDWNVIDYVRGNTKAIELNTPDIEKTVTADTAVNGTTDAYFDLPTDNTNLSITNGKLAFTNGRSSNGGYKVETQDFTGLVDFSGISDGIKYIARDKLGNVFGYDGVSIGLYEKTSADDNRLVFDTESGKWFTTTGGELVTNGTFDTDVSGWTNVNATLSHNSGRLQVASTNNYGKALQTISGLTIGETYVLKCHIEFINTTLYLEIDGVDIFDTAATTLAEVEFVANNTSSTLGLKLSTSGRTGYFDNISVYKKEATLGTELPNPICFIDDKPYQVTSGTPMDRLVDYPSIPKNVMESTYVDGDLEVSGEVRGKNQCTAWINFDGTTTPPTIKDSYNVASIVRSGTGLFDVYFKEPMLNTDYSLSASLQGDEQIWVYVLAENYHRPRTTQKVSVVASRVHSGAEAKINMPYNCINVFGGKN